MQKNKEENPEIRREKEEKRRASILYGDEEPDMFLFPGLYMGGTASATESTGLIQNIPITPAAFEAYDELYSYRRTEPTADEEE